MPVQTSAPYVRDGSQVDDATLDNRLAKWELLPNMRLGTFARYRENGHRAFVTLDGSCCCHHGEVSGTIRAWITHEKNKERSGTRWSTCDCANTSGLTRRVDTACLPPKPSSYFEMLEAASAERLAIDGDPTVEALATPLRCESGPIFLANDGRFFCGHGNKFVVKTMPTARKKQTSVTPTDTPITKHTHRVVRRRFHTKGCKCLLTLPNRSTFPELPFVTTPSSD